MKALHQCAWCHDASQLTKLWRLCKSCVFQIWVFHSSTSHTFYTFKFLHFRLSFQLFFQNSTFWDVDVLPARSSVKICFCRDLISKCWVYYLKIVLYKCQISYVVTSINLVAQSCLIITDASPNQLFIQTCSIAWVAFECSPNQLISVTTRYTPVIASTLVYSSLIEKFPLYKMFLSKKQVLLECLMSGCLS